MVLGELVPKSLAIAYPGPSRLRCSFGSCLSTARWSGRWSRCFNGCANWMVRRLGIEPQEELALGASLEELDLLFRSSGEEGTIDEESVTLLTRAVRLLREDCRPTPSVPRIEIVGVAVDETVADLTARAVATGFSRFPVYDGDLDQIVGVGHVKDAFAVPFGRTGDHPVRSVMVDPVVVPETIACRPAGAAPRAGHAPGGRGRRARRHGRRDITLEDVLEEIVGEIDDEHDRPAPPLTRVQRPGEWVLGGGLHRDEVFDACGFELPDGPFETLAGFVLDSLGRIPTERRALRARRLDRGGRARWTGLRVAEVGYVHRAERAVNLGALAASILLLAANAFFVAVEFALVASRRTRSSPPWPTRAARRRPAPWSPCTDLSRQLAGAQLGITICSLLLGFVAEPAIAHALEAVLHDQVQVSEGAATTIGFALALSIVVFLHMVLGEMVPKNIAIAAPERTVLALEWANRLYLRVFGPAIVVLNALANVMIRLLGAEPADEISDSHTSDELADMVSASRKEGLIQDVQDRILRGALAIGEAPIAADGRAERAHRLRRPPGHHRRCRGSEVCAAATPACWWWARAGSTMCSGSSTPRTC